MQIVDRGMGVATVSLLVKQGLRNTSLTRTGDGRVQGRAFATRALPVLQATIDVESIPNYEDLFRLLMSMWARLRPAAPSLEDLVGQVHKDFHQAIEGARKTCFPKSRPCDDYFHLRHNERAMSAKCRTTELVGGRWVKTHYDWVRAALELVRFAPTIHLFSAVWRGLLSRLEAMAEADLASWLRGFQRDGQTAVPASLSFVGFWAGIHGLQHGTASGSESAEALHSPWQAHMKKMGMKSSIAQVLAFMQRLYIGWAEDFGWATEEALCGTPNGTDPSLLNGAVLGRCGRITAVALSKRDAAETYLVDGGDTAGCTVAIVASDKDTPLDLANARAGIASLRASPVDVEARLIESGVLFHGDGVPAPQLSASKYRKIFNDVAYVERTASRSGDDARTVRLVCTCSVSCMHAQCEHMLFAESLPHWGVPPMRSFAELPLRRPTGRKPGSTTTPRGKAAAKRRAEASLTPRPRTKRRRH
jgi:hypothetical protein